MKKELISRVLHYVAKSRKYLFFSMVAAVASVLLTLLGPVLIGQAVDYMLGPGLVDFAGVLRLVLILLFVYLLGGVFTWLLSLFSTLVANQTVRTLRREMFEKINQLPLQFYDTNPHGDITSRFVNDIDAVADGLLQGITQLLSGIVTIVGTLCFMLWLNWGMAIVVLLSAPAAFFVARFVTTRTQSLFREQSKQLGALNGYAAEMIEGQKIVRSFNQEERTLQEFQTLNQRLYVVGQKAQFYSSLTNPTTRYVNNITYAVVGVIGSIAAIFGKLSVGGISSFLIYANQFAKPFNEITGILTQLQSALASAQRIFEVLDQQPESETAKRKLDPSTCKGAVCFEHVKFSYRPDKPLITDFNLSVQPGSRVAIVGRTGAGKTTMVNLLMRFYEVDGGKITVDGTDIREVTRDSLRSCFGMVLQDTWLFEGTIRENLAYANPNASFDEIVQAAKAAHAHSFIKRLANGYDTHLSDAGDNLSQGQKQLLTIARVMLAKAPMLILDEATSNIDTMTEKKIQQAFLKMMEGKTSFVIAHRLSTIRESDVILVMDKGNVVEKGTHDELLAQKGYYYTLYNSQFAQADAR